MGTDVSSPLRKGVFSLCDRLSVESRLPAGLFQGYCRDSLQGRCPCRLPSMVTRCTQLLLPLLLMKKISPLPSVYRPGSLRAFTAVAESFILHPLPVDLVTTHITTLGVGCRAYSGEGEGRVGEG